ncbi:hypothetical protein BDZ89DRAFT_1120717 [Hymenopellis radicata]|nr:hypothetical protein BDZ89DRAFT_1120717 [Hymenopellis radicata]
MAPQPPPEKMSLRNKRVVTPKELIPVSREEQREAREKADQVKANKKATAAKKKAAEQKQKTARIAAMEDQLAKEDKEMQNVSVADMLRVSEKIIPIKAATRTRKPAPTASSSVVVPDSSSATVVESVPAAVVESVAVAVVETVSVRALLENESKGKKVTESATVSKEPVSDGDSSVDDGGGTPPPPIHKLTPKRFPQSPRASRTLHRTPSPLARPDFGLVPELESEGNLPGGEDESDGEMEDGTGHDTFLHNDPEADGSDDLFFGNMGVRERQDEEVEDVGKGKAARHQGANIYDGQEAEDVLDVSDGDGDYRGSASPSADDDRMLVDSDEEDKEDEDEAEMAREIAKMQAKLLLKKAAKAKGKESQTAATKGKKTLVAKLQVPKVKPDKVAMRKEITDSRALPPPSRPSMAVVPTAGAKTGSKRKETDDNEKDNAKRSRTSDVGGMNGNWQLLLPGGSTKEKGKAKKGKQGKSTSTPTDTAIVLKDVDLDAVTTKTTRTKKTFALIDLPFANHPVDTRRFKESFIPALYDWSGSLQVEYPFSTTGHADLKSVVVDLWTNVVFKYLSPLDEHGKSRVENDAVMNVAMQYLRTLRSEIAKNARAGTDNYCETNFSSADEIERWVEYQLTDYHFIYLDPEAPGPEAGAFLSPIVLRVFGYYLYCVQTKTPAKSYGVPAAGLALCATAAMYSLSLWKTGVRQTTDEERGSKNNAISFRDDPWGTISASLFVQIKQKFTLDTWRTVITAAKPYLTKKKGQNVPVASGSGLDAASTGTGVA